MLWATPKDFRCPHLRRFSAVVIASAITARGSISFSGSSSSASAPNRSYHPAALSSFASMASATPPTSAATARTRSPAANSKSPPNPWPWTDRSMANAQVGKPALHSGQVSWSSRGHPGKLDGAGADRVKASGYASAGQKHRDKRLRAAGLVVLSRVAVEVFVKREGAAVEVLAVVMPPNRLLAPVH